MSNNAKNLPEVKLGQYKGLAVTRHVRPLSEKTIDQEMVHQTRMRSVYHNSTAPAKRGSRVLLDFVGFMDGEEIPDSRMEKVMVVLGDGKLMPAAEDAIYGHTAGETFRFDFTYPEQFRVEELSGKTAQFEIKLHSVAEKTTPELNEAFARAQGYADLAAMREAVRAKKRKIHEDAADRAAGQELLAKSLLTQLLILLRRAMDAQPQAVESLASDEKIAAIMQYLSQHPTESVSIDDLAARFYISKYHMMRRFRAETGYTVHAYLTGKRLALAREQIAAGTPILQAASACGFGDYSAFCRAYRRQFGQPPSSAKQDAAETPKSRKKA